MNEMCSRCHILSETHPFSKTQRQFVKSYFTSVHSTTIQKSGLIFSATCVDCHGSHNVYPEEEDKSLMHRQKIHDTCGTCHQGAASDFMAGIHGEALKNGNPDAPTCIDCHEKHYIQHAHMKSSQIYPVNIPKTCLKCHGNTELIDKYNWSPLTEENYGDSYHGAALKLGDISVAHCASCHMAHKILSHTNPQSPTHWDNLSETCGVCHTSDDPVNIDNLGKIHVLTAKELHPISKLIANLYRILIVATLGFFIAFISSDLYRNILNRRNKKG